MTTTEDHGGPGPLAPELDRPEDDRRAVHRSEPDRRAVHRSDPGRPGAHARLAGARWAAPGPVLADAELAMMGVRLPWPTLGHSAPGEVPGHPSGREARHVEIIVPDEVAHSPALAHGLLLLDSESTPVVAVDQPRLALDGAVTGLIRPDRRRESAPFAALSLRPADLPLTAAKRLVVVAGRPPMSADVNTVREWQRAQDADVLWVVPVANPTPDGLSPRVLLRTVEATVQGLDRSRVVACPLWWRDPGHDAALVAAVAEAYAATGLLVLDSAARALEAPVVPSGMGTVTVPSGRRDWAALLEALQKGAELPAAAPVGALQALLRWRPQRSRRGVVLLFTGYSGSGKSTVARAVVNHLAELTDRTITLLDGDVVRTLLSSGLGFDRSSRDANVRRIGFVAAEVARHGGIAVCAPIAPYQESRDAVRAMVEEVGDFVLVHVSTPLEVCEQRDLKGLYARARAGLVAEFTGVSDPYEPPLDADLSIDTAALSQEAAVAVVIDFLRRGGWLGPAEGS